MGTNINLVKINLRDFYPWYTHDEFAEIPEVIAAELFADKKYNNTHERVKRRFKVHSLDAEDGLKEAAAIASNNSNPEFLFAMIENRCRLCQALNSLPEIQGRRIEAHYLLGKTQTEIAEAEGVKQHSVSESINRGLRAMKKYLETFENCPIICP